LLTLRKMVDVVFLPAALGISTWPSANRLIVLAGTTASMLVREITVSIPRESSRLFAARPGIRLLA